jgi:hypothetical protein
VQSRAEQRKGSESTPERDATVDASSRHGHFVPFLPVEFVCAKLCFALRAHLPLPQPMSAQIDPAGSAERNAATLKLASATTESTLNRKGKGGGYMAEANLIEFIA